MKKKIIIAVDGYSASGKSTLAKDLAAKLGYNYIDTGAMYRAVTLYSLQNGTIINCKADHSGIIASLSEIKITFQYSPESGRSETWLNGKNVEKEIRGIDVSENVSQVSAIKEVRKRLVGLQKQMGKNKGIVMDGRDIGTVVFPYAELKLFVIANLETRAKRRHDEMLSKGIDISFENVRKGLHSRDTQDTTRKESPLLKANDAVLIDNTMLNRDQQVEIALKLVKL